MLRKSVVLLVVVLIASAFSGCKKEVEEVEAEQQLWVGVYRCLNEETGEIKTATVLGEDDASVTISFESVRTCEEFKADFKSSSLKYAIHNSDNRCIKFNLKSGNNVISVDDIWINKDVKRSENWTGKYELAEVGEPVVNYGDKNWNGEYQNFVTGLNVSVYAITEDTVLLTYTAENEEGTEKVNIVCNITDNAKCTYSDENHSITVSLINNNKEIEISDIYDTEQEESEFTDLSGIYTAV